MAKVLDGVCTNRVRRFRKGLGFQVLGLCAQFSLLEVGNYWRSMAEEVLFKKGWQ
jgi:hypothetical protein